MLIAFPRHGANVLPWRYVYEPHSKASSVRRDSDGFSGTHGVSLLLRCSRMSGESGLSHSAAAISACEVTGIKGAA